MPQAATVEAPDELDQFVQSFKTAAPKPSSDDDDELDSFVKQQQSSSPQQSTGSKIATPDVVAARANKDGSSTGKAVENLRAEGYTTAPFPKTDARSHDFGWSKDDSGNWTQDPNVAARDSAKSTIPITPFQGTVPTTPLDQRAANLGQPSIQLQPPPTDTTQIPLNVFTNTPQAPGMPTQEELPAKAPLTPPQSPMDQMIDQEQGFEDKAHQQGDALVSKLSTGSKKVPLPYMAPDGSLRTMKLGDFQKLAADYLDDPSIPKSRGAAFAAGAAADTVSTLNDIFFSPLGMASSVTGLAAARALQTAGKQGTAAIKLAQEYQEMKNAGASADELAGQEQLVRQAVAATARTQSIVAGAETAQKASGVGFGMQGANQFIAGVQKRDWSQAAAGLASMAIGGSEGLRGLNSDGISEGVKARTAEMAVDNLKNEGEPAAKVPVAPPGEKNVTAQGSHEIIHQAQLPAPAEEVAPAQAATPAPVGAGEELTPEKPETLKAQVDALAEGTNPIVYIPKGQTNAPEPPSGTQVTEVGGDKPGAGTYYHDDSITPQEIKESVKDGTYGKLLGNTQTKEEAISGNAPVAVTARTPDGNEAKASLVDGTRPDAVAEQTTALQSAFPNAQISVETPEQVVADRGRVSRIGTSTETLNDGTRVTSENPSVHKTIFEIENQLVKSGKLTREDIPALRRVFTEGSERYQAGSDYARFLQRATAEDIKPTESAALASLSRETPQLGERDEDDIDTFVQRHREASSVIQPQAEELSALGGKLKHIDPHVADALNGLADGRYFSREDLLKIAGGIRDAKTSADLRSIVNEFSERKATPSAATTSAAKAETAQSAASTKTSEAAESATRTQPVPEHAEQVRERTEGVREGASENGNQLGPQEAPAGVGDHVRAKSDKLKGRTMRVTKVGATGVYGQTEENGPPRFLRHEEVERAEAPIAKPVQELLSKSELEPRVGVRYSGLSPAAIKAMLPDSWQEYLKNESEMTTKARNLEQRIHELDPRAKADLLRSFKVFEHAPGTPEDLEAIYHHSENPDEPLTAEQRAIYDEWIKPLDEAAASDFKKLNPGKAMIPNHVHRIAMDKGGMLDRLIRGEGRLSAGNVLSKSAPGAKRRTMMALEDENGKRTVVSIKGGTVTEWKDGKPTDLGRIRGLATQGLKSKGEILSREAATYKKQLAKLEDEYRVLTSSKGRADLSKVRIRNLEDQMAVLREGLQDIYRKEDGQLYSDADLLNRKFLDRNGKEWDIKQATTKEIEANTGQKYYKNALSSSVLNFLQMRRAARAFEFIENLKHSPDFQQIAVKQGTANPPTGWKTTQLDQMRGYLFEPHIADALDMFAKRTRSDPSFWNDLSKFLRTAIFYNPLLHAPNILAHGYVEKGIVGMLPHEWPNLLRAASKAYTAVTTQNGDYIDALQQGAPLRAGEMEGDTMSRVLLKRMGKEIPTNGAMEKISKALGYANPAQWVRAIYDFSEKTTSFVDDFVRLQAIYHRMARHGWDFKGAMDDVDKHIPDYYLPSRVLNNAAFAKLLANPKMTLFSAYHCGVLKNFAELAKDVTDENVPKGARGRAIDRFAALAALALVVYPAMDLLAKLLTGDKTARMRRSGPMTLVENLYDVIRGDKSLSDAFTSIVTPAPILKAGIELTSNRDLRTGKQIADRTAPFKTQLKQYGRYGARLVAPVGQVMDVNQHKQGIKEKIADMAGIKMHVPSRAEALARKYASDAAGTTAPDDESLERSYLRHSYEQQLREKKISPRDIAKAKTDGKITGEDQKSILQRAARTSLQNAMRSLTPEQALKVWDRATPVEKKDIRPLLANKLGNLSKVSPDRRAEVKKEIEEALHPKSKGQEGKVPFHIPAFLR